MTNFKINIFILYWSSQFAKFQMIIKPQAHSVSKFALSFYSLLQVNFNVENHEGVYRGWFQTQSNLSQPNLELSSELFAP